jgi:transcriptional regulator with XRE-family HTH domain
MLAVPTEKKSGNNSASELRKKAGSLLRERRCELGLSQREVASRVNMEYYTFVSQIEAGKGRVPAERMHDWSIALEMEPKEFATMLLRYYDPHSYEMIFGGSDRSS